MKTSGFREIYFSKIDCKNCGKYVEGYGKRLRFDIQNCPICKGTGFIGDSNVTELELDVFSNIRKELDKIQPDQKTLQDMLNKKV